MRCKKIIEINLPINDVENAYSDNSENMILALFNSRWSGICYSGVYIIQATKVLRSGLIKVNKATTKCSCSVSIIVECDTIQYERLEIIVAKISDIDAEGNIFAKSEYAIIIINSATEYFKYVKKGDIVPILVENVEYSPYKKNITIFGLPFIPLFINEVYEVIADSNMTEIDEDKIIEDIKNITLSLNEAREKNKNMAKKFDNLLIQNPSSEKGEILKKIQDVIQIDIGNTINLSPLMRYNGVFGLLQTHDTRIQCTRPILINLLVAKYRTDVNNIITLLEGFDEENYNKIGRVWDNYTKFVKMLTPDKTIGPSKISKRKK